MTIEKEKVGGKGKDEFRRGRWGLEFKNGKLYEFTDKHVLVMRGWPTPMAWIKRKKQGWKPTRKWADMLFSQIDFLTETTPPEKPASPFVLPDGQMILPGIVVREELSMRREYSAYLARTGFIRLMPEEVRREVRKYSSRRWHVLNILARCPGAMDLSRSNPALLFALASNWAFHKPAVTQPMRAARALVWKKQRLVQEWLGFPGTEPVRRLLAKIAPDAVDVESLLYLREALDNPHCMKLPSHLPRLNRSAVMLASDRRVVEYVTPRLLEDVLHEAHQEVTPLEVTEMRLLDVTHRMMVDTVRMARLLNWERCPRTFSSVNRIKEVHDDLAPRIDMARLRLEYKNLPDRLPDPPFAGNEHIIPLQTPEEMFREGYLQKNCVGSHIFSVASGAEFVYRVLKPVRATLAVVVRGGRWTEDEFLQACNQPVDDKTRREVFSMLFRTQSGKRQEQGAGEEEETGEKSTPAPHAGGDAGDYEEAIPF